MTVPTHTLYESPRVDKIGIEIWGQDSDCGGCNETIWIYGSAGTLWNISDLENDPYVIQSVDKR